MRRRNLFALAMAPWLGSCAQRGDGDVRALWVQQVTAAETAFARSMADRDLAAFANHVADDAVFINGGRPLRGKAAIVAHWQRFFEGPRAPFAWKPDLVEVLDSGTLAQSIGPVSAPDGRVVARFYSTWRAERPGLWRVVLDNGYDLCDTQRGSA